ncbi:hypothetical protein ACP70R_011935 [Stipagrostis hirtigluma subsp. patula]
MASSMRSPAPSSRSRHGQHRDLSTDGRDISQHDGGKIRSAETTPLSTARSGNVLDDSLAHGGSAYSTLPPQLLAPGRHQAPDADRVHGSGNRCCNDCPVHRHNPPERFCPKCTLSASSCYWEHIPNTGKAFIKVFTGDYDNQMAICKEFSSSFNGKIDPWVVIKVPSGRGYGVTVLKKDGCLFFASGWSFLVDSEEINRNDFGVFTYNSNKEFRLQLFNNDGNEKVASTVGLLRAACPSAGPVQQSPNSTGLQYMVPRGLVISAGQHSALKRIWVKRKADKPLYVAQMSISPIYNGQMFFSKKFSNLLPSGPVPVRMKMHGSNIMVRGRLARHRSEVARITCGWSSFVSTHGLVYGATYAFKFRVRRRGLRMKVFVI